MKVPTSFFVGIIIFTDPSFAQTYPIPKLFERTLDACIDSNMFPESEVKHCSQGAQQLIADTFCKHQSKPRAVSWDSSFTGTFQSSWKLTVYRTGNKEDGKWVPFDKGGAIFTSITCENALSEVTAKAKNPSPDGPMQIQIIINNTNQQNQEQSQDQKQDNKP